MTNGNTSKLSILYLSQFRAAYQKVQRSVKRRIESKVTGKSTQVIDSHSIVEISTEGELETVTPADSLSDKTISINIKNNEKQEINQQWEISNGKDSLYAYVVETDRFMVQFFEPNSSRSDAYRFNNVEFELLPEYFVQKVKDTQLFEVERSLVSYVFQISLRPCIYYLHLFMNNFDYKDFSSNDDIFQ